MIVLCKVTECKYCSSSGFCHNKLLVLTPQGTCSRIYDNKGRMKPNWNFDEEESQEEQKREEIDDTKKDN
ncbi:MAG: hypothetical protein IKN65_07045 [Clostridia bacterium]|nr:hypothetical protein [Clostridia bacterium]